MIYQLKQYINDNAEIVILSYGMGVESTAILLRWIYEPETRPCSLDKLIVITAQTGDEWPDTGILVDKYIIPVLRENHIRFVQVARHGHNEKDGIIVFEDSREPTRCFLEGDYKLSKELMDAGTVPQFGGTHRCAIKFKNTPIEQWLDREVREPAKHVFGYNVEEKTRIKKSEEGFVKRLKEKMVLGFNNQELSRVKKAQKYDTPFRTGVYPLLEWDWTRSDCINYIKEKLGVIWKKSACVYCPFAHNKQNMNELISRQIQYPKEVAFAMLMEHLSLSMNIRSPLYSSGSLKNLIMETNNMIAYQEYQKNLRLYPWALYRVRRIYKPNNMADRCTEKFLKFNSQEKANLYLLSNLRGELVKEWDINYDFIKKKTDVPCKEEFLVPAPAIVDTKARYGISQFNEKWNQLTLLDIA